MQSESGELNEGTGQMEGHSPIPTVITGSDRPLKLQISSKTLPQRWFKGC
jgi:hypothetical protein